MGSTFFPFFLIIIILLFCELFMSLRMMSLLLGLFSFWGIPFVVEVDVARLLLLDDVVLHFIFIILFFLMVSIGLLIIL